MLRSIVCSCGSKIPATLASSYYSHQFIFSVEDMKSELNITLQMNKNISPAENLVIEQNFCEGTH